MRKIKSKSIIDAVEKMCGESNILMPADVLAGLKKALRIEKSPGARCSLSQNIENAKLARSEMMPLCQDTGQAVFFVEMGVNAQIQGDIYKLINEGVRRGYKKYFLRASVVADPLKRVNTGDNTPAVVHCFANKGDKLRITFMPKGGGAENMSRLAILTPSEGVDGVKMFVNDTAQNAAPNACAPIIVGVGLGGNFEVAPLLAKKALLRKIGSANKSKFYNRLEKDILSGINSSGIGAQGLGGTVTAMGVFIETQPCHISALPVAVNIQCHVARHMSVIL